MKNYTIEKYCQLLPKISDDAFIADGVRLIGDIRLEKNSNIWYNSVLRGDINFVSIGQGTNIQDNSTLHVAEEHPCIVGDFVTVGHNAILHGCVVEDNCLIGMGAIILNGAKVGENSIVGAGSIITENKVIPPNSLVIGSPGRVIRTVTSEEILAIKKSAHNYIELAANYNIS